MNALLKLPEYRSQASKLLAALANEAVPLRPDSLQKPTRRDNDAH